MFGTEVCIISKRVGENGANTLDENCFILENSWSTDIIPINAWNFYI